MRRQAGSAKARQPGDGVPMSRSDYGRPLPAERWDRQYREGALDFLDSIDELAHYAVIAGYVQVLFEAPAVLDIGCGHGRLVQLLAPLGFRRYVGIDLSREAIARARRTGPANARFHVADFDQWRPTGRFSVIVFCESLNYAKHPAAALLRYAHALEPGGAIIVSLYRHPNHPRIWRNVERHFRVVDATTVRNRKGQRWDIRVLREMPGRREEADAGGGSVRRGGGRGGRGPGA